MSDDGSGADVKKRGRPSAKSPDSKAKKRGRSTGGAAKKADGESPAKRGRGRPKGSGKKGGKAAKAKKPAGSGGRRGRPKKEDKKAESANEEEADEDEN